MTPPGVNELKFQLLEGVELNGESMKTQLNPICKLFPNVRGNVFSSHTPNAEVADDFGNPKAMVWT